MGSCNKELRRNLRNQLNIPSLCSLLPMFLSELFTFDQISVIDIAHTKMKQTCTALMNRYEEKRYFSFELLFAQTVLNYISDSYNRWIYVR